MIERDLLELFAYIAPIDVGEPVTPNWQRLKRAKPNTQQAVDLTVSNARLRGFQCTDHTAETGDMYDEIEFLKHAGTVCSFDIQGWHACHRWGQGSTVC
jgi:hypothetical protein